MNTYQLWILNPSQQFIKLGPPAPAVDANLWYQILLAHFGSGEVRLEPVARTTYITAKTVWPGPRPEVPLSSTEGFIEGEG